MTRILLVEDESSLSEPLSFLLGREGFEVEIAEDGQLALDIFANGYSNSVIGGIVLVGLGGGLGLQGVRRWRQSRNKDDQAP